MLLKLILVRMLLLLLLLLLVGWLAVDQLLCARALRFAAVLIALLTLSSSSGYSCVRRERASAKIGQFCVCWSRGHRVVENLGH